MTNNTILLAPHNKAENFCKELQKLCADYKIETYVFFGAENDQIIFFKDNINGKKHGLVESVFKLCNQVLDRFRMKPGGVSKI